MISITSGLFSGLFGVMILMEVIAFLAVAGGNEVAEMQLSFWKEKLPTVQVPETVAASTSPLTQEEVNTFAKIIKDGNLRYHANQFCNSANLLCDESVSLMSGPITVFANDFELSDDINHIFFSSKELREGGQITLPELYSPWKAFLPSNLSQMIPFAAVALSDVLSSFGISEKSNMAMNMNMTLIACEAKVEQGEVKSCSTSIKGMIEFVLSNLGSSDNIELVFHPAYTSDSGKKARVTKVVERKSAHSKRPPLACHRFVYPYGVFYCHSINGTLAYTLELEVLESKGNMYSATALCHPNSQTKESLYCHLFAGDSLLWLTKEKHG